MKRDAVGHRSFVFGTCCFDYEGEKLMAKPNRLPNFKEMYPEADEAVLEVLK